MLIQSYAEQLLFSTKLADKLAKPVEMFRSAQHDGQRSQQGIVAPKEPGRPRELQFASKQEREIFPSIHNIDKPEVRGRILHYFANHELLAIELMALALLKFPQSSPKYQRELINLLAQEQNHLRLYLGRMSQLGVEFGEVPVNDFFWKTISPIDSPLKFVAHLNLGFEQANLDFALHYGKLFHQIGDQETAAIMRQVYLEEIGHVAHGVHWFNSWRDPDKSDWQEFQDQLAHPFTPANAKGIGYDESGRKRSGLSPEFIASLRNYRITKKVFYFNPNCEPEIASGHAHFSSPLPKQIFAQDFTWCMSYLAEPNDILILDKKPTSEFLEKQKAAGFFAPKVESTYRGLNAPRLGIPEFDPQPWGWSPVSRRFFGVEASEAPTFINKVQAAEWYVDFYEKNISLIPELGPAHLLPVILESQDKALSYLKTCHYPVVLKSPMHSGGQGNLVLQHGNLTARELNWLKATFEQHPQIVAEAWVERVCDWGQQIVVFENGVRYVGLTRFMTNVFGQMQSYILGDVQAQLPPEALRKINARPRTFFEILRRVREAMSKQMRGAGYLGPAGIDAFVFRYEGEIYLRPVVEINSRYTFGHVALALESHLTKESRATWKFMHRKMVPQSFNGFTEFAAELQAKQPLEMQDGKILRGAVFTNDPQQARDYLGVMEISLPSIHKNS